MKDRGVNQSDGIKSTENCPEIAAGKRKRQKEREGGREGEKGLGVGVAGTEPFVRFAKIYVPGILRMDAANARNSSCLSQSPSLLLLLRCP